MLHVRSTVSEYLALLEVAPAERERAWVDEYEGAHPELFELYYDGYGHPNGRVAAVAGIPALAREVAARETRMARALQKAADDFVGLGLLSADQDLQVVLMVGTGHSNAWVKPVDGVPVLFVALELLPPADLDDLLVIHELVHVVHMRKLLPVWTEQPELANHLGLRVWLEGLAVAATRELLPGRPDHHYLFVDDETWIAQCRAAAPNLVPTLLSNLDVCDAALAYSLVGVTEDQPWPSRAGYWVGDLVVSELLTVGTPLSTLMAWGPGQVTRAFKDSNALTDP